MIANAYDWCQDMPAELTIAVSLWALSPAPGDAP
jgi:hypothetical protein